MKFLKLVQRSFQSIGLAAFATFCFTCASASETVQTKAGVVSVGKVAKDDLGKDSVFLKGRVIYREEWSFLDIDQKIEFPDRDVLLISVNSGGSGVNEVTYTFLIVKPTGDVLAVSDPQMASFEDSRLKVIGNKVVLDLGTIKGQHRVAVLDGNRVTMNISKPRSSSVPTQLCSALYRDVLGSCIESAPACVKIDFSNAIKGAVIGSREYSSFNESAFNRYCVESCRSKMRPEQSKFESEVCAGKK